MFISSLLISLMYIAMSFYVAAMHTFPKLYFLSNLNIQFFQKAGDAVAVKWFSFI